MTFINFLLYLLFHRRIFWLLSASLIKLNGQAVGRSQPRELFGGAGWCTINARLDRRWRRSAAAMGPTPETNQIRITLVGTLNWIVEIEMDGGGCSIFNKLQNNRRRSDSECKHGWKHRNCGNTGKVSRRNECNLLSGRDSVHLSVL